MKNILVILKEPFLDRIPSLKTLVLFLCDKGLKVTILTSSSKRFGAFSTEHTNLEIISIRERTHKHELPTTLKLALKTIRYLISHKIDTIIGGDLWGNVIASKISPYFKGKYVFFALEFPQIVNADHPVLSRADIMQNKALCQADYIITHDDSHLGFIVDNFNVKSDKILKLANASFTSPVRTKTIYLHNKYGITRDDIIALHSGGFGKWFRCEYLAEASKSWGKNIHLIFHIGRKPEESPEFDNIYENPEFGHINYSLKPLSNDDLDKMIASADVGIAMYSTRELGYRAELMGLAAGKIGNYLKCGVPVIATNLPSLSYISDFRCGILVNDETEIEDAITQIMSNYSEYKANAYSCYMNLWHPQNYLDKIYNSIL